jgi:hypothetical protein
MPNALRSGAETAQRFLRPAPTGANWRYLLLMRLIDPETETEAGARAEAAQWTKMNGETNTR